MSSACLSDIDLATLHKCRLDQRIKYQLSAGWINRRGAIGNRKTLTTAAAAQKERISPAVAETKSDSENERNNNRASVIKDCDCCVNDNDKCCAGDTCEVACQRSTTEVRGDQVDGLNSVVAADADVIKDTRKVGKCNKHAVISCGRRSRRSDNGGSASNEKYLTRRRSGTWP